MKIKLLFFGITTDLLGMSSLDFETPNATTVQNLKNDLLAKYPQLAAINSYAIAVNENYATDDLALLENDTVAIIPPVSGG